MKLVIFDIDDVLNDLVEHTYELAGIDSIKLLNKKRYTVKENGNLTASETARVLALWEEGDTYTGCSAEKGIAEIADISKLPDVRVLIHSYCVNQQAAISKTNWVEQRIDTTDIEMKMEIANKTPIENVYAVVEDNLEYLMKCNAKIKILINKPYNQAENYNMTDKEYGITRLNSTHEAINMIKELIMHG